MDRGSLLRTAALPVHDVLEPPQLTMGAEQATDCIQKQRTGGFCVEVEAEAELGSGGSHELNSQGVGRF